MTQPSNLAAATAAATACLVLAAAGTAFAESEGSEFDFEPDELPDADDDTAPGERPTTPDATSPSGDAGAEAEAMAPMYPRDFITRPLALPVGVVETSFSARAGVRELVGAGTAGARGTDAFRAAATLAVDVGIAEDLQVGIRYGAGSIGDETIPGRAASVEAVYSLLPNVAAQVALPIHFDPFAVGLTLGVPIKIELADKVALVGGHDLVTFRLHRFQPHVNEPAENDNLAAVVETNTVVPRGEYALRGALIYQSSEELAVGGELALRAIDFDSGKPVVPIFALFQYSATDSVDVGARVGLFNMDGPGRNFGATAFAAIRM